MIVTGGATLTVSIAGLIPVKLEVCDGEITVIVVLR